MTQQRKGLLVVWTDIPAELEYDFNEWYNREHMGERIRGVPGFIRGRRFVAFSGAPKYLAVYEADSIAVLASEPYLALVRNPDTLSRRFIPRFLHTLKGIGEITAEAGEAEGAVVGVLPLTRVAGREDELRAWMSGTLLPELTRQHGIVAARLAEKDARALAGGTAQHMRPTDRYLDALLMIEAVSEADLAAALPLAGDAVLASHGAGSDGGMRQVRLIYTLRAASP